MPTLEWIGKSKVINHHLDVSYRVLEEKYTFNKDRPSENKIIHGDNLSALKSLLPEYEGKIKCIYIDPPYNTGNEGWVYNDNVNDPKIKKWLGDVVGKEGEDLSRHDKWLCMMYPRLKLLHQLLAEDGAIFISIDDNEQANLKLICDEIFGIKNFIGNIIQNKQNSKNDTLNLQKNHEFILVYRKSIQYLENGKITPTLANHIVRKRPLFSENGEYYYLNDPITTRGDGGILNNRVNLGYTVYYNPDTGDMIGKIDYDKELAHTSNEMSLIYSDDVELISQGYIPVRPPKVRGKLGVWTWDLDKFNADKHNLIITGKKNSYALKKRTFVDASHVLFDEKENPYYLSEEFQNSKSILEVSTNEGTKILNQIMERMEVFENPKNPELITYLVNLINSKDFTILDSFAGSGTTAHAVLNLNKTDSGNRKFILIEMEDYAETTTAERVRRVINGYGETKGTGGDFTYYELGDVVLHPDKTINEDLPIEKIQEYIWITETHTPYRKQNEPYYLGTANSTAYYFCYEKGQQTTLDYDLLSQIQVKADSYVIYADTCILSEEELLKYNIAFKKIPRDITTL